MSKYKSVYTLQELSEYVDELKNLLPGETPLVQNSRFADFCEGVELEIINATRIPRQALYFSENKSGQVVIKVSGGS